MSIGEVFQGGLFAGDLLAGSIVPPADWLVLDDLEASFRAVFARFPTHPLPKRARPKTT